MRWPRWRRFRVPTRPTRIAATTAAAGGGGRHLEVKLQIKKVPLLQRMGRRVGGGHALQLIAVSLTNLEAKRRDQAGGSGAGASQQVAQLRHRQGLDISSSHNDPKRQCGEDAVVVDPTRTHKRSVSLLVQHKQVDLDRNGFGDNDRRHLRRAGEDRFAQVNCIGVGRKEQRQLDARLPPEIWKSGLWLCEVSSPVVLRRFGNSIRRYNWHLHPIVWQLVPTNLTRHAQNLRHAEMPDERIWRAEFAVRMGLGD